MTRLLLLCILTFSFSCGGTQTQEKKKSEVKEVPQSAPSSQKLDPSKGEFWNKAYDKEVFVFGIKPNVFLKEQLKDLEAGKILLPGEGEGRNAVFAAKLGWKVDAYDLSSVGKEKADKLALKHGTSINYWVGDFTKPNLEKEQYDVVAVVFLHVPIDLMKKGIQKSYEALKPGGRLIVEVFAEGNEKIAKFGPKSTEVLYTVAEMKEVLALSNWAKISILEEKDISLDEGFHQGKAKVIRLVAQK